MIKNAGPLRLGAGRRCGLLADGLGGFCCRLAAACLSEGRRGKEGGPAAGVGGAVYVGQGPGRWSAGDGWGGQCSGGDLLRQFGGI